MFHGRHLKRCQLSNWIMLDLCRLDPMLPGVLIGERNLFGRTVEDPSGLWRAILSSQITNHDPEGMTVTTDDLRPYQLAGSPKCLDKEIKPRLTITLGFSLVQRQQVE